MQRTMVAAVVACLVLAHPRQVRTACDPGVSSGTSTNLGLTRLNYLQCRWDQPLQDFIDQSDATLARHGFDVRAPRFGAVGDGAANDRPAIQAAIDAAAAVGGVVYLPAGVYRLASCSATQQVRAIAGTTTPTLTSCLILKAGVGLIGAGRDLTVVKLGASENTVMMVNDNAGDSAIDTAISIEHLTIDGNRSQNTATPSVDGASTPLWMQNVTNVTMRDVTIQNVRERCAVFSALDGARLADLYCANSDGDGWILGPWATQVLDQHLRDSELGRLTAANIGTNLTGLTAVGNPVLGNMIRTGIAELAVKGAKAGIKLDGYTQDVVIGRVRFDGDSLTTDANCGLKVQGACNGGVCTAVTRVTVGEVLVRGCQGRGLYIDQTQDVAIGSYVGVGNDVLALGEDVFIDRSLRPHVTHITTVNAARKAVLIQEGTQAFSVDSVTCHNPGAIGQTDKTCVQVAKGAVAADVIADANCTGSLDPFPCCTGAGTGTCQGHGGIVGSILVRDDRTGTDRFKRAIDAKENGNVTVGWVDATNSQFGLPATVTSPGTLLTRGGLSTAQSNLAGFAPAAGSELTCTNCTVGTNPCAANGGTVGGMARRLGGVWRCDEIAASPIYDVRASGASCTGTTDDTAALTAALSAGAGKQIVIPAGCTLLVAGPSAGTAKFTIPTLTSLRGADRSATIKLARKTCSGGSAAGAGCTADTDCRADGGSATCAALGGLAAFAPTAGQTYTLFTAASSADRVELRNLTIDVGQATAFGTCSGGTNAGKSCKTYCSSGATFPNLFCTADASCTPGTCTNLTDCSGGGGTCVGARIQAAGPGNIVVADLSNVTADAVVDSILVQDLSTSTTAITVGGRDARVRDVHLADTAVTTNTFTAGVGAPVSATYGVPPEWTNLQKGLSVTGANARIEAVSVDASPHADAAYGPIGIEATGAGVSIRDVGVTVAGPSGQTAMGVKITGANALLHGSTINANRAAFTTAATTAKAYGVYSTGGQARIADNYVVLDANLVGLAGVHVEGVNVGSSVEGNYIFGGGGYKTSLNSATAGVTTAADQVRIENNQISGGFYCYRPAINTTGTTNVTFLGNRCLNGAGAKVVMGGAGVRVIGNYLAWGSGNGGRCTGGDYKGNPCLVANQATDCTGAGGGTCDRDPVVWAGIPAIGDAGSSTQANVSKTTSHGEVQNNLLYSDANSAVYYLRFFDAGQRCASGTRNGQSCSADDSTNCPASSPACGDCCVTTTHSDFAINGNTFLGTGGANGIDFFGDATPSGNTTIASVSVASNTFANNPTGARFPSSVSTALTNINLVGNNFSGTTTPITNWDWSYGLKSGNVPELESDEQVAALAYLKAATGGITAKQVVENDSTANYAKPAVPGSVKPVGIALTGPTGNVVARIATVGVLTALYDDGTAAAVGDRVKVSGATTGKLGVASAFENGIGTALAASTGATGSRTVRFILGTRTVPETNIATINGGASANLGTTGTQYFPVVRFATPSAASSTMVDPLPAGLISKWMCSLGASPGGTNIRTFSPAAATGTLTTTTTCSVTGAARSCIGAGTLSIGADEQVSMKSVVTGTATAGLASCMLIMGVNGF